MKVISNSPLKSTIALAALQDVIDPEIGLNIVDLGLIYGIDFDEEEQIVYCSMTLTTQFCPMGESITSNVKSTLQRTFEDYGIEVELTFEPSWNYEFISEEGKLFLNR